MSTPKNNIPAKKKKLITNSKTKHLNIRLLLLLLNILEKKIFNNFHLISQFYEKSNNKIN